MSGPYNNEPPREDPKKDSFIHRLKQNSRFEHALNVFLNGWVVLLNAVLMLIGIVLSFFYLHIGGLLVGLAFGLCFFREIKTYFSYAKGSYVRYGLFKTLMWIGTILYFLITIPTFIIAILIGFGIIFLIRLTMNREH